MHLPVKSALPLEQGLRGRLEAKLLDSDILRSEYGQRENLKQEQDTLPMPLGRPSQMTDVLGGADDDIQLAELVVE